MRILEQIRRNRKQVAIAVLAILVTALVLQGITERAFLAQASIAGAFRMLEPDESRGTVTLTARYLPPPYGFSEEKLLNHFAEEIGLYIDGELRQAEYEGRRELVYEKLAAEAHSIVKLVYLTEAEQYYLCAEITLYQKDAGTASAFRDTLEQTAEEMKLSEISTTLELCGIYAGEIPLAEKDELTDGLLSELYAQSVYENRENKNYTVYAYTGAVKDYITVEEKKINVQVAIYYDRGEDRTEVVLASPIGLR
ncbi:MAG: YwmB family TATA-box binding protein [Lachnospiraceae bacterium]|nr:YwmB family TATA-box binding protein [Lachnospiraceae bacterium]